MPSVDDLANAIRAAIDRNRDLLAGLGASREQATEFRDELGSLGFEARAARAAAVEDRLEETQVAAAQIAAKLESALAATEAARTGTAGGKGGTGGGAPPKPTPSAPPPGPPDFGSIGYPISKPHRISWSDLYHVVNGDDNDIGKGGHAFGTGRPGKTEFPEGWDDGHIGEALAAVATRPSKVKADEFEANFIAEGIHRGITVKAVVRPDGSIEAGWPVKGPGVKRNPWR